MSVTIPATPHYFKVPGPHSMQAWRLDRADDVLITLSGFASLGDGRQAQVSVTVEGADLEVARASFAHPGNAQAPLRVSREVWHEVAAQVRDELLTCLRDGTWVPTPGV